MNFFKCLWHFLTTFSDLESFLKQLTSLIGQELKKNNKKNKIKINSFFKALWFFLTKFKDFQSFFNQLTSLLTC